MDQYRRKSVDERGSADMAPFEDALVMLESKRVTDKKNGIERLLNLLNTPDNLKLLDKSQLKSKNRDIRAIHVSWCEIFRRVEAVFTKESEKLVEADRTNNIKKPICNLLHKVIFVANRNPDQPLLEHKVLFSVILRMFTHPMIPVVYGTQIIDIVNHYLSIPSYVSCTPGLSWRDFIKILTSQIKKAVLPVSKLHEVMIKAIMQGSEYQEVISILRTRVVDFYKYAIGTSSVFKDQPILLIEGFLQLCKLNAVEFRGILCGAGEALIVPILQCIQGTKEKEKACELFLIQLKLHMPCDMDIRSSLSFFADDPSVWTDVVEKVYQFCIDEIREVAVAATKKHRATQRNIRIPRKLLALAVKCTKLVKILSDAESVPGASFGEPPAKRQKKVEDFEQIVEDTIHMPLGYDQLVWLTYIGSVIREYPSMLGSEIIFASLLNIGCGLLASSFITYKESIGFLHALLYCERSLIETSVLKKKNNAWNNVWDILLKSVSVNEATPGSIELLDEILSQFQPTNIGSLLTLYTSHLMPLNAASLNLLRQYLISCSLPSILPSLPTSGTLEIIGKNMCPRLALLKWLIPPADSDKAIATQTEILIPILMFALLVQRSNYVILNEWQQHIQEKSSSKFEEFERIFLACSFVSEKPAKVLTTKAEHEDLKNSSRLVDLTVKDAGGVVDAGMTLLPFLELIHKDLQHLPGLDVKGKDYVLRLEHNIFRAKLYLNFMDMISKYKVKLPPEFEEEIERDFEVVLQRSAKSLCEILSNQNEAKLDVVSQAIGILKSVLKTDHLSGNVKQVLAKTFPKDLLEILMAAVSQLFERETNHNNSQDWVTDDVQINVGQSGMIIDGEDSGEQPVSKAEQKLRISIEALKCICDYSLICDNRDDLFSRVIEMLTTNSGECSLTYFDVCEQFICGINPVLATGGQQLFNKTLLLLQVLCRKFHNNANCCARLWKIFADLTPSVRLWGAESNFMILVGNLSTFLQGIRCCRLYFQLMKQLAEFDPKLEWSCYTPGKPPNQGRKWPLLELHNFLTMKPPSHLVRLSVIEAICSVFHNVGWKPSSSMSISNEALGDSSSRNDGEDQIKKWFAAIKNSLNDVFNIPATLTSSEKKEEGVNCVAVVTLCLTRIAFANVDSEQHVLSFLTEITWKKNIMPSLAFRALEQASSHALQSFVLFAPTILEKWVADGFPIEDIPYQLFSCASREEFYIKYYKHIAINLLLRGKRDGLEKLSQWMKITMGELVRGSFCNIFVHLVAKSVLTSNVSISLHAKSIKSSQGMDLLRSLLGGESGVKTVMITNLESFVLEMISYLLEHDICDKWGCTKVGAGGIQNIVLPNYVSTALSEDMAKVSLGILKEYALGVNSPSLSVVHHIAVTSPKSMYYILLEFVTRIHSAHNLHVRLWRLHHFVFFVDVLMDDDVEESDNEADSDAENSTGTFSIIKGYLCHFVIHAYLRFLCGKQNKELKGTSKNPSCFDFDPEDNFLRAVLFNLRKFLTQLIKNNASEIKTFYKLVVHKLVSAIRTNPHLADSIVVTLDLLIRENHEKFPECIRSLDPFPNEPLFQDYKSVCALHEDSIYGLEGQLRTCLRDVNNNISTTERLEYIRQLLSNGKEQLGKLVDGLEGKRFKDECTQDVIHNLIHLLVSLINNSEDDESRVEACKCLGEIGPVDLSVLVLPQYGHTSKIVSMLTALPAIIKLVSSFLTDESIHVVSTTSHVLSKVLEFTECAEFLQKNSSVVIGKEKKKTSKDSDANAIFEKSVLIGLLKPFQSSVVTKDFIVKVNNAEVASLQTKLNFSENINFSDWIVSLTSALIDCTASSDSLLLRLKPLCLLKTEFCEEIFPFVIYSVLAAGKLNPLVRKQLSTYFSNFFKTFVDLTSSDSSESCNCGSSRQYSIYKNKQSLRNLLRCVQFLREHPVPMEFKGKLPTNPWDNNFWIEFNYLDAAKAAQYCGAYLTSILFGEIFALEAEVHSDGSRQNAAEISDSPEAFTPGNVNRAEVEKLLLKAYTSIGEQDGVYGCGSARFSDFSSQIQHLQSSQCWDQVYSSYDSRGGSNGFGVCNAMKNLGLYNSCWTQLKGIEAIHGGIKENEELSDIQYECGWRLSHWDINCDKVTYMKNSVEFSGSGAKGTLHKFVYDSIQGSVRNDRFKLERSVTRSYEVVLEDLRHANLESSENLYGFLSQLQMLRIIEDITSCTDEDSVCAVNTKWKLQHQISGADFKYQEPILSLKKVLLKALNEKIQNKNQTEERISSATLEKLCDDALFDLLVKARDAGRLELAEKYTHELSDSSEAFVRKKVEIAKNHWARGNEDVARYIINDLLQLTKSTDSNIYPSLLLLQGEWLFVSVAERPSIIFQKYLQQACQLYEKNKGTTSDELAKAYITLAEYADSQFQKLVDYLQSDLFREKLNHLNKSKEQTKTPAGQDDLDMRKSLIFMKKQCQIDNEEIQNTIQEKGKFQLLALRCYFKALHYSNKYDLLIFRAIALWLENNPALGVNVDTQADQIIAEQRTAGIPSYKFIAVLHQLSARLGNSKNGTSDLLEAILMQCAEDHPYHTLPVILTQAMLHKDKQLAVSKTGGSKKTESSVLRITAAGELLSKLKKQKKLGSLTSKMQALWNALITFANFEDKKQGVDLKRTVPPNAEIANLKDLLDIPIPTLTIPVSPSGQYRVIGIKSFNQMYHLVGGINAPKRISCVGANGCTYNMLLKGNDDLRQDAVMQQVFGVMNQLLEAEPSTKKKRLLVRTYRVVPLSQRSGVIEWCENTQTFGDYLVGSGDPAKGAHTIYRPSDFKPTECRRMMMEVKDCGDPTKKLEVYTKITDKFKPVFHHFFFENFKDAGSFFERRLAYTRSVATSSIVGYILGLGDRHVLNILIDRNTAEFIHIDLGVAFEQGKILPTPETIPFRLTRDVVDGMGFSGTEGVFRRSCENTMEVLRKNAEIILTILEVLLYDPLYLWTLTEDRKQKLQPADSRSEVLKKKKPDQLIMDEGPMQQNNSAARELRRLRCKLAGIQEGRTSGSTMSVPGHVAQLIQHAVDPHLLSRLFCGWQPYL